MSAPLVFMDTETTGLGLDDDIWEFAATRRDANGMHTDLHLFIEHDSDKCVRLPQAFRDDHRQRWQGSLAISPRDAVVAISELFAANDPDEPRPHVVGAVPNFDTERLASLFIEHHYEIPWHYHLIDVENLAAGFLGGVCRLGGAAADKSSSWLTGPPVPPWDSEELSKAVDVNPEQFERHTAMGDVRWAMAIYDAVMGGPS